MIDALDLQIIQALQYRPRAPFRLVAEVLEVSEQTVARRYRRLCADGILRIIALLNPSALGQTNWMVRLTCRPDAAPAMADALARRDDIAWIALTAGGSEIICVNRPRTGQQRDELLLRRLPRTAQVLSFTAQALLHRFETDAPDWTGYAPGALSADRIARLCAADDASEGGMTPGRAEADRWPGRPSPSSPGDRPHPAPVLDDTDHALLAVLGRDGRASLAELSAATGLPAARAGRRLGELLRSGAVVLDVDLATEPLGFHVRAAIWLTVAPSRLDATGRELVTHPQVAFCGAVTGASNLAAVVLCRDAADFYRYVTEGIGSLDAVSQVETALLMRWVKQSGTMMRGGLLGPVPT